MKKKFMLLWVVLFLTACASNANDGINSNNEDNANNQVTENEDDNETESLETETLFTFDFEESGDYEIQNIQTDASGTALTFTGLEDIDRKKEYFTYIVDQNDHVFEGIELAEDEEQDRRCTDLFLSPNGDYLVYNCHDDGIEFSIYDMHEKETIHQMESSGEYIRDIHGISNDKEVYYEIENDDYETELILYNAESEKKNSYVLNDLFDMEDVEFNRFILSDDGQYILINALTALYLIDTEDKSAEEIVNVDDYVDEYDADFFIYDVAMSPDATYTYYKISENDTDPIYSEHFFHNLDNNDITAFGAFDYTSVRGFDVDGNVLLEDDDQLLLYNVENEETHIIPDVDVSTYTRYFTLSHSGEFLLYTDRDRQDDDTYTQNLKRVALGDISSYETTDLKAQTEEVTKDSETDEINLSSDSFDEQDKLLELWESSTDVMYPTTFPDKVENKNHHFSGDEDNRRYSQTIFMASDSSRDNDVGFTATRKTDSDRCTGFDDLDLVDTIDGDDYYFYDYKNRDVEAAVSIDDDCYFFETEEHSEEEMLEMAQSLEAIDEPVHDLSVEDLQFPTMFPIQSPKATNPRIISYSDGDKVDFLINYRGDSYENDIKMDFEIRVNEPSMFDHKDRDSVDIDGFDEAYYFEDSMKLMMYNGTHYYILKLDIDNDMIEAFGLDHIYDTFIEIGNSIE